MLCKAQKDLRRTSSKLGSSSLGTFPQRALGHKLLSDPALHTGCRNTSLCLQPSTVATLQLRFRCSTETHSPHRLAATRGTEEKKQKNDLEAKVCQQAANPQSGSCEGLRHHIWRQQDLNKSACSLIYQEKVRSQACIG